MKALFPLILLLVPALSVSAQVRNYQQVHTGWEAFTELTRGNDRYMRGKSENLRSWSASERRALVKKRNPQAVVVTCSDSRISPDVVFDQRPGSLYIIRTAGMTLDGAARGSIELAVKQFGVPLIVFLASEHCLALHEAGSMRSHPDTIDMNYLFRFLKQHGVAKNQSPAAIQMQVQQHMRAVVEQFVESSVLVQKLVAKKKLLIAEARLDFISGKAYFRKVGAPELKDQTLTWESKN